MRTRTAPILIAAAAALLLAGCAGSDSSTSTAEVPGGVSGGMAAGAPEAMPQDLAAKDGSVVDTTTTVTTDRQVIRTAYVAMRADDVAKASVQVHALVKKRGGLVSNEDAASTGDTAYANITAQIPADGLDAFIADVSALGTVDSVNVSAQDVTTQVVDLDARIKAMQASIDRMTVLMSQAQKIDDLLAIETQLSQRQAELDSMTAQRTYLGDQVAMSTISVSITPASQPAEVVDAPGFWSGLKSGWAAFVSVILVSLTALGFLLPFLVVMLIVLVPFVFWIVRLARRPHKAAAAAPPAANETDPPTPTPPAVQQATEQTPSA
jgi:hypothetical protein